MLLSYSVELNESNDFEALLAAINHYKTPAPGHEPDPRLVQALDSILERAVDSAEVESRTTFNRTAKQQPD